MTVGGWGRALRAGVFSAVCVLLAALAHVMMSATSVPWEAMAAGVAATGGAGWFLAGRERGRALIVTVVVTAQTTLHQAFSAAQKASPSAAPTPMSMADMPDMSMPMGGMDMPGMSHAGHVMGDGTPHTHSMIHMDDGASLGMFAGHLAAAVLCGLWLAYGERAVFGLLRTAAARLTAPLRMLLALPAPAHRPPVRRRRPAGHRAPARLFLVSSLSYRGPPKGVAVSV
ncbi:hypothetical protein ACVNF4_32585 [Streptomyces sp. S6]